MTSSESILGRLILAAFVGLAASQIGPRRPPNYSQDKMPVTSFSCRDKILGGYYADPETDCQMFHVCVKVPGQGVRDYKFLCPNDTSFDQENQICDDWFNIDCEASTLFYSDNFDLYRIGSDFGSQRSAVARLPNNNINNAVSEPQDENYLQKEGASDLLRGSHSGNFFSNRNRGKEDYEDEKKATKSKSNVRKLLTGKRPVGTTQAPLTEAPSQQRHVYRTRGNSNFRSSSTSTTQAPETTTQTQVRNNNYETARQFRLNTQAVQYDEPSNGEFLKTAPSQNLGASNFNRVQQAYKGFNTSVGTNYNFYTTTKPLSNERTAKPNYNNQYNAPAQKQTNFGQTGKNYYNPSTTQAPVSQAVQNYNPSTTQKPYSQAAQNFYNPTTTQKPYSQPAQNFYNPSTTQKPYSEAAQNFYNPSTTQKPYSQPAQNFYNPSTTQKPYSQPAQNFYNPSTTQKPYSQPAQNFYNPSTTQKPYSEAAQNFYNPSTTQKPYSQPAQNFYNPSTTQKPYSQPAQNFYNPSTTQKPYSQPAQNFYNPTTQNYSPVQNYQTTQRLFNQPQLKYQTTGKPQPKPQHLASGKPSRGSNSYTTDATEQPRPFTTTLKPKQSESKDYDYAYYDDSPHVDYSSGDAVEFSRTKAKA